MSEKFSFAFYVFIKNSNFWKQSFCGWNFFIFLKTSPRSNFKYQIWTLVKRLESSYQVKQILSLLSKFLTSLQVTLILYYPQDFQILGWYPAGPVFTSWGEGASLALVGHPSSNNVTIKLPSAVDVFLHRPASHFSFWVLVWLKLNLTLLLNCWD